MEVREAEQTDARTIANLWYDLAKEMEEFSEANRIKPRGDVVNGVVGTFSELLKYDEDYHAHLAIDTDEPVGFVDFKEQVSDVMVNEDSIYLRNIYVSPNHRNNGIGGKLLERVITFAESENAEYISIPVEADNTEAQKFYESYGFSDKQIELIKMI